MKNLILRIATAVILLPVVIFAFFSGGYFLLGLLGLVGAFCAIEAADILLPKVRLAKILILLFFLGLLLPMVFFKESIQQLALFSLPIFAFNAAVLFTKDCTREVFEKLAALFFLCFYVFVGLACVFWLQSGEAFSRGVGIRFILLACIATWINDSFAYFSGNLFGKNPLFKQVSQNKTWEGFFGGSLSTVIFALLIAYLTTLDHPMLAPLKAIDVLFIALPAVILAPLGDLIESRLKRLYQVKDSSNILPGHGGLLDRIDSLLVVLPWTALYAFLIRPLY